MILSVTLSKPVKNISEVLENDFKRVKIKLSSSSSNALSYFAEFYTEKQVFHKKMTESELYDFLKVHSCTTFKNVVERTETEEITLMAGKRGKVTRLVKKIKDSDSLDSKNQAYTAKNIKFNSSDLQTQNRKKNYILEEGKPVPFLVRLGIMTAEGRVINSRYDKFRQINRFLEFINDILPDVLQGKKSQNETSPLQIVDFGSGKSYLTFAVHYFLTEIKQIPCRIFGLDLKKDVIDYCARLAGELNLKDLSFAVGNIADFNEEKNPDIIITLHACDTATDYALDYAVKHKAKAILSVPCCQHELNAEISSKTVKDTDFEIFAKYGLIKEKFSALLTDAIRGDLLENCGYKVQMLEFIDDSATPKNIMIRAVLKENVSREFSTSIADSLSEKLLKKINAVQKFAEIADGNL